MSESKLVPEDYIETLALSRERWQQVKRLAGPNNNWPGRAVYCMGNLANFDESWLQRLNREALQNGFDIVDHNGDLYLVSTKGKSQ